MSKNHAHIAPHARRTQGNANTDSADHAECINEHLACPVRLQSLQTGCAWPVQDRPGFEGGRPPIETESDETVF